MLALPPFNSLNTDLTNRDIITDRTWADKVKAKYFEKLKAFHLHLFRSFLSLPTILIYGGAS